MRTGRGRTAVAGLAASSALVGFAAGGAEPAFAVTDVAKSWTFATAGNTEGWSAYHDVGSISVTGGALSGTITGTDPHIRSESGLNLNITTNRIIRIKLKNGSAGAKAQIYFTTTSDGGWDEAKSKAFPVTPNDADYTEYVLDMASLPSWQGTLSQLRIDPSNGVNSGTFAIDYVYIGSDESKAWEFSTAGQTEGWFPQAQVSGLNVASGALTGNIVGVDPQVQVGGDVGVNIDANKYVRVGMRNSSAGTTAQLYFTTISDGAWNEAKHIDFTTVADDSGFREYLVDMSAVSGWSGSLSALRIDPANGVSTGSFAITYIRIGSSPSSVWTYPPSGEATSTDYAVSVNGQPVAVYKATAGVDNGTIASFDFSGTVTVKVTRLSGDVTSAVVRPASAGVVPSVNTATRTITMTLTKPKNLSVEINGSATLPLYIFANPLDLEAPQAGDPNVIYYGPGVSTVTGSIVIGSGQTLYLAPGAVVKAGFNANEPVQCVTSTECQNYDAAFRTTGSNVKIRGRGMIDAAPLRTAGAGGGRVLKHALETAKVNGTQGSNGVSIEGITVTNTPWWNVRIVNSENVAVRNVKVIDEHINGDGIDVDNSRNVTVEDSFVRSGDDSLAVKATYGGSSFFAPDDIVFRNNVVWNTLGRSLGITWEAHRDFSDITWIDNDVIHHNNFCLSGWGDSCFVLSVWLDATSPSLMVSRVRFENIRIEDSNQPPIEIRANGGTIDGVVFKNIQHQPASSSAGILKGASATEPLRNVVIDNLRINGARVVGTNNFTTNAFTSNISFP